MTQLGAICMSFFAAAALATSQAPVPNWVGTWAAAQQLPEANNALPAATATDATLRQLVRLSAGGRRVRVLLSNAFGTSPLRVDAARIALAAAPDGSRIRPASDRALTFDGGDALTIPAGGSYWSDSVAFDATPLAVVAVSIHLPVAPERQTGHPGSRSTSYVLGGNHVADAELAGAKPIDHWYQLAGIAVEAAPSARAIVTLGDSITDGHGATTNGNDRWPDLLAQRLQAVPRLRSVSVLNHGIGGNRLLQDGLGPNALARFDRDVLAQPGVHYLIVLEGINDLGTLTRDAPVSAAAHDALVAQMIGAYRQIVERAHAAGIRVYGATILPDGASVYYHPDARNEADRQAVNAWIRTPGNFDAVIDFDALLRDPADPRRLQKPLDSGDGLHPSPAGYRTMAAAIPLDLFAR